MTAPLRHHGRRAAALLAATALVATVAAPASAGDDGEPTSVALSGPTDRAVVGEYLVALDAPPQAALLGGASIEHLGFGIYRIIDVSTATDAITRAQELSDALGAVVEPNRVSYLLGDNTEPDAFNQWTLENTGQFVGGVDDADIDGEEAWDVATGEGIVVAVIDSGADMDHPDIAPNLWVNDGEIPDNGIDDDGNGFVDDVNGWDFFGIPAGQDFIDDNDPEDTAGSGHGTAVSAIIGAPINGVGMAGVAPDVEIMVLRACGLLQCPDSTVIESLYYAANNGADVINLSLGRNAASGSTVSMRLAVEAAIDAGAVVVAAAGNDGADNDVVQVVPASLDIPGLLSVAMTDHADVIDPASNYGDDSVHLGAPGVDIWSATYGGGHGYWLGTSFASPTTAGVAALLRDHRHCLTNVEVANTITNSGDSVASLDGVTISGKRLNAFSALDVRAQKNGSVTTIAPGAVTFTGGTAGTTWTFGDGGSAMGASAYNVYDRGVYEADDGTDIYEVIVGVEFHDTCSSSFEDEITWFSAEGITLGCDTVPNFCPNGTVIRSHMASFLARALDLPAPSGDYFTDDDGSSHENNINRLYEAGITMGCADGPGLYCPDDVVTR